ncbi:hypothetical protein J3F83DRAFT_87546 [Trichoderma novae-zelandiae]
MEATLLAREDSHTVDSLCMAARLGWFRCLSLPSHPGETPGPNGDGRRLFPRRSPSSSKRSISPGSSPSNQGDQESPVPTDAEHSKQRAIHGTPTLIKIPRRQRKDHGRSRRDAFESAGTRPMHMLRRLHGLDDSYDCFFSLYDPQYASKPDGSEGRLQLVWLGRRHMPPAMSARSKLALWRWRRKQKKGWKRAMSLVVFFSHWQGLSPHLHPGRLRPAHGAALGMQVITADAA